MIKQSFLNTLKGLSEDAAKEICWANELAAYVIPNGMASIMIARGNTVMLWLDADDNVKEATAGDGLELEDDLAVPQ